MTHVQIMSNYSHGARNSFLPWSFLPYSLFDTFSGFHPFGSTVPNSFDFPFRFLSFFFEFKAIFSRIFLGFFWIFLGIHPDTGCEFCSRINGMYADVNRKGTGKTPERIWKKNGTKKEEIRNWIFSF